MISTLFYNIFQREVLLSINCFWRKVSLYPSHKCFSKRKKISKPQSIIILNNYLETIIYTMMLLCFVYPWERAFMAWYRLLYMVLSDFMIYMVFSYLLDFSEFRYLIILSPRSSYVDSPSYWHDICYILYPLLLIPARASRNSFLEVCLLSRNSSLRWLCFLAKRAFFSTKCLAFYVKWFACLIFLVTLPHVSPLKKSLQVPRAGLLSSI